MTACTHVAPGIFDARFTMHCAQSRPPSFG